MTSAFRILEAESLREFQQAVPLMREFLAWVRTRYRETPAIIDLYYHAAAWENELGSLRQLYSKPSGVLLLSIDADQPAGCVGMRKIDADICEMKRLYVRGNIRSLAWVATCASIFCVARKIMDSIECVWKLATNSRKPSRYIAHWDFTKSTLITLTPRSCTAVWCAWSWYYISHRLVLGPSIRW